MYLVYRNINYHGSILTSCLQTVNYGITQYWVYAVAHLHMIVNLQLITKNVLRIKNFSH